MGALPRVQHRPGSRYLIPIPYLHCATHPAPAFLRSYVEQNDIHSPAQTVIEALQFSARLRLPPSFTNQQVGWGRCSWREAGLGRAGGPEPSTLLSARERHRRCTYTMCLIIRCLPGQHGGGAGHRGPAATIPDGFYKIQILICAIIIIIPVQVKAYVEEVLDIVDLLPQLYALVGSPGVSGLSTEARKRLTIAVELVANPSCIFLDEPTSGEECGSAPDGARVLAPGGARLLAGQRGGAGVRWSWWPTRRASSWTSPPAVRHVY